MFAYGKESIEFSHLTINSTQPQVFVAMQFGQPNDTLYQQVIQPQATDLGLSVIRIDEVAGPGIIFEDIKRQIAEAKIVIAEITAPNQNVFYELGYAHALNKRRSCWRSAVRNCLLTFAATALFLRTTQSRQARAGT